MGADRAGERLDARAREAQAARTRPRITGRMGVLLVVFAVLLVSWASSMRAYLVQRSEIDQLRATIAQGRANLTALDREKKRWHDPKYVEDQARLRLGWVLPGEVSYQVIGRNGKPLQGGGDQLPLGPVVPAGRPAWWHQMGASVAAADHPERVSRPAGLIGPPRQ